MQIEMKRKRRDFTLWDAISAKLSEFEREKTNSWYTKRVACDKSADIDENAPVYSDAKRGKLDQVRSFIKTRRVGLRPTREQTEM